MTLINNDDIMRKVHSQNEANEIVAVRNKTQLLMDVNHRQINNLPECLNRSRI